MWFLPSFLLFPGGAVTRITESNHRRNGVVWFWEIQSLTIVTFAPRVRHMCASVLAPLLDPSLTSIERYSSSAALFDPDRATHAFYTRVVFPNMLKLCTKRSKTSNVNYASFLPQEIPSSKGTFDTVIFHARYLNAMNALTQLPANIILITTRRLYTEKLKTFNACSVTKNSPHGPYW